MKEPEERAAFDRLTSLLADAFAEEGRPGGDMAAKALRAAPALPYRRTVSGADPGPVLDVACGLSGALPLGASVLACRHLLDWISWEGTGLERSVSARLYTTELVGPDGHVAAESVRIGLLASEAWTDYPISSHAGEETYLVIAGTAEWSVGGGDYAAHAPGALIHHPSWVLHGRRTLDEPFLGAWRWSGDLDLSTFRVAED
ncbi:dimethylsulfonioproprionate lyase family protein [Nitratireductor sp. XY-223]|uniref:dimethylsulfonioproprionate lyase family protein n=1 Tax=Nitratireductor sp. XY-223 TaxID=2561926 RepID=UPI0010AA0904|nr:dimethylsulfonioproprionate lyase family protein [Nitratireductor sp. XY-223]